MIIYSLPNMMCYIVRLFYEADIPMVWSKKTGYRIGSISRKEDGIVDRINLWLLAGADICEIKTTKFYQIRKGVSFCYKKFSISIEVLAPEMNFLHELAINEFFNNVTGNYYLHIVIIQIGQTRFPLQYTIFWGISCALEQERHCRSLYYNIWRRAGKKLHTQW